MSEFVSDREPYPRWPSIRVELNPRALPWDKSSISDLHVRSHIDLPKLGELEGIERWPLPPRLHGLKCDILGPLRYRIYRRSPPLLRQQPQD